LIHLLSAGFELERVSDAAGLTSAMQEIVGRHALHSPDNRTALPTFAAARIAAWGLAAAIIVLSVVPPDLRPGTPIPHYLEHFAIYAVTGCAFGLGYGLRPSLLAMRLVIFSGCIEIIQLFIPGRHARFGDFLVDAIATCAGVTSVALLRRIARTS
jgi:VanZ family protein